MITNSNILNVQVVPSTPMFISSNSPGQKQVMHPEWIQWYRAIQTRVGGATGTLITSIDFKDLSTIPIYTITNSEDTSSGTGSVTITIALNPEGANLIFAGPTSGSAIEPTFRMLINNDLPIVDILHGGTGLTITPTDGELLIGNGTGYTLSTLNGSVNQIDITNATGSITLSIDSAYIGQTSITTLGTITTGLWHGSLINSTYGGTGVNNGAATLTLGGNTAFSGAFSFTGTLTGNTTVTFPTSGTLLTSTGAVTSITGTTNEVISSASTGNITLSLPQAIATTSNVQFGTLLSIGVSGYVSGITGITIDGGNMEIAQVNSSGTTDSKIWRNYLTSTQLVYDVVNDSQSTDNHWLIVTRSADTISTTQFYTGTNLPSVGIDNAGVITFNQYGSGSLSTNASGVISASDGRFKTKTRKIINALETINKLIPTYYQWNIDSPFKHEYEELGFIAQEVATVIPEASPEPETIGKFKNYHDRAIIAYLVKAVQELDSKITEFSKL